MFSLVTSEPGKADLKWIQDHAETNQLMGNAGGQIV